MVAGIAICGIALAASASADPAPTPPSGADLLFSTPHLQNVTKGETIAFHYERQGPNALSDEVTETIADIHPDGTKLVTFAYLTGENRKPFPGVDDFRGNPLLMAFLQNDVDQLKDQTGIAAAHFRNDITGAMASSSVTDTQVTIDGKSVPAHEILVKPFGTDERLGKLPTFQQAEYRFVVADAVPGGIESMSVALPADTKEGLPAWSEKLTFSGVKP